MSVIHCFNSIPPTISSSSVLSSSTLAISATTISRLHLKPVGQYSTLFSGIQCFVCHNNARKSGLVIVRASSETSEIASELPPSNNKQESVSVDKLPLESKLQERAEQKLKMKMAKKIRLRRKRLVRKRKLRKKGRWPPSKMKKLKNV